MPDWLKNLIEGGTNIAGGFVNQNFLDDQIDYLKSLVTPMSENPFSNLALDAIENRPGITESPFYKNAERLGGRDPNTDIFKALEGAITDPGSLMGAGGPYAALTEYYTELERRKAAKSGLLPGTGSGGALNQGAVDQITGSLARNVAPLYPQTVNAYAGAYGQEQDALNDLFAGNIDAYGQEQNAYSNWIRDMISGINPYQGPSNVAIAGLGNLWDERTDQTSAIFQGGGNILENIFGGLFTTEEEEN